MPDSHNLKYLRIALVVVGIIFIAAIYPLMMVWPSGWQWHTGVSDYPMMIVGMYVVLGVFLLMAARNPLGNLGIIWFTVWSSLVHAAIMAYQTVGHPEHQGHLMGDIPALFIVAIVLAVLTPKGASARLAPGVTGDSGVSGVS